jgi:hypothetical protein
VFKTHVDSKDLLRVAKWVTTGLDSTIDDRPHWAVGAIHIAGGSMMANFASEGSTFGRKWQNLSAFTQQKRVERGFAPDHPILVQTGELRRITAQTLLDWRAGATGYHKKDRDGRNSTESGWNGDTFHMTLGGPKAQNNYGGFAGGFAGIGGVGPAGSDASRYGAGAIPPRPFLHLRPSDIPLMTERVLGAFMGYWQRSGSGVKREYGRMMVLPIGARKKW